MSYNRSSDDWSPTRVIAVGAASVVGVIALIFGLIMLCAAVGSFDSIDAGHIAVLRNGGLSNQNIRGFLDPGSGTTYTGMFSTENIFPAQQQVYTIDSDPGQGSTPTADSIDVPSSDGVEIQIEGTLYYSLNLKHDVLGQFDDRYGTQTYTWNGRALHPYDGADGWNAFVNAVIRPTLQNELRTAMSTVPCAAVDPACSLVKNASQTGAGATGASSDGNLTKIQDTINGELASDLQSQLGGPYLQQLRFSISTVTLPSNVQNAINDAQAAFAKVSTAQAAVAAAKQQALANEITQQGYSTCPACAVIAEEAAIPPTITTYAPGAGVTVGAH